MKKIYRIAAICFSITLCSTMCMPLPAAAAETESGLPDMQFIADFQNLTDAVENLSGDSTEEDVEEVLEIFKNTDFGSEEDVENEDGSSLAGSMSIDISNSGSGSDPYYVQQMYAKLQLELANKAKLQAQEQIESIRNKQEEKKKAYESLSEARDLQAKAETASDKKSEITAELRNYMNEKNIVLPESTDKTNKNKYTVEEWNQIVSSLTDYIEQMENSTQQEMVYIQDFMKQYNDYLYNANTAMNGASQSLASLSRGQTMLGGGSTGLMVTGVLAGIIVGIAGTLLVIRLRKRQKKDVQ